MGIKIEVGKYYVTRSGRHVGPMVRQNSSLWAFRSKGTNTNLDEWGEEGNWELYMREHPNDIVAEWLPPANNTSSKISPIGTRREIVSGVYGNVAVEKHSYGNMTIVADMSDPTPEELREAAHTLNQIAEVLEENAG